MTSIKDIKFTIYITIQIKNIEKLGRKTNVITSPGYRKFHYKADIFSNNKKIASVESYTTSLKDFERKIRESLKTSTEFTGNKWL